MKEYEIVIIQEGDTIISRYTTREGAEKAIKALADSRDKIIDIYLSEITTEKVYI